MPLEHPDARLGGQRGKGARRSSACDHRRAGREHGGPQWTRRAGSGTLGSRARGDRGRAAATAASRPSAPSARELSRRSRSPWAGAARTTGDRGPACPEGTRASPRARPRPSVPCRPVGAARPGELFLDLVLNGFAAGVVAGRRVAAGGSSGGLGAAGCGGGVAAWGGCSNSSSASKSGIAMCCVGWSSAGTRPRGRRLMVLGSAGAGHPRRDRTARSRRPRRRSLRPNRAVMILGGYPLDRRTATPARARLLGFLRLGAGEPARGPHAQPARPRPDQPLGAVSGRGAHGSHRPTDPWRQTLLGGEHVRGLQGCFHGLILPLALGRVERRVGFGDERVLGRPRTP